MYIPGFDPKKFSNDDLFEKHYQLAAKKVQAALFGKVDLVNQLQQMMDVVEHERRERIFNEKIGSFIISSPAVTIESDPFLKRQNEEVEEEIAMEKQTVVPSIRRVVKSSVPVKSDDGKVL